LGNYFEHNIQHGICLQLLWQAEGRCKGLASRLRGHEGEKRRYQIHKVGSVISVASAMVLTRLLLAQSVLFVAIFQMPSKSKHFIGSAPSRWLTLAPAKTYCRTIRQADDLEYYGYDIPWAGSISLRIVTRPGFTPHVTSGDIMQLSWFPLFPLSGSLN
jgi:hypothetical protein